MKAKETAPEFRVQMHDVTTNVGEPATFDCHATGFPRPDVFWTKASLIILNAFIRQTAETTKTQECKTETEEQIYVHKRTRHTETD